MSTSTTNNVPLSLELAEARTEARAIARHDTGQKKKWTKGVLNASLVEPGNFDVTKHWYERCLNATLHPIPKLFMGLNNERIAARYCHLHPEVQQEELLAVLRRENTMFRWTGADLFNVTAEDGRRGMMIVETNSCPSGQKSYPFEDEEYENSGYYTLMGNSFYPWVCREQKAGNLPEGGLAVVWDKNEMETSGYAAALADIAGEKVYFAPMYDNDPNPCTRWVRKKESKVNGLVLEVRTEDGVWHPIRAAFRYVTQAPWTRLPLVTATLIYNPVIACLAGGRNKMVADRAYEMFNLKNAASSGLKIHVPDTIRDVTKDAVPMWVASMGGHAVVKNPYSNAGQGVWTITSSQELDEFMALPTRYDKFIVQALIGNSGWSSATTSGTLYHTGTVPNKKLQSFVCDIRMMVCATPNGFRPLAMYSRRAKDPLVKDITGRNSWDILGTNLSERQMDGSLVSNSSRLLQMDVKDFNRLGVGLDDLIDGYVQCCCASTAIDEMAKSMVHDGKFDAVLFSSVCADDALLDEIRTISDAEIVTDVAASLAHTTNAAMEVIDNVQAESATKDEGGADAAQ